MKNYLLTPEAETNLLDIIDVISMESPDAVDRVLKEFKEIFQLLGGSPGIGHYREELLDQRFRFANIYSYQIVYIWNEIPIKIIAIVHGARDLPQYLKRFENK